MVSTQMGHLEAARQRRLTDVFSDAKPAIDHLGTILSGLGLEHKVRVPHRVHFTSWLTDLVRVSGIQQRE